MKKNTTTKKRKKPPQKGPWNVRGIDPETRNAARMAARRADLTIGEWVNQTIAVAAQAELKAQTSLAPTLEATLFKLAESIEHQNSRHEALEDRLIALQKEQAEQPQNPLARIYGLLWGGNRRSQSQA